MNELDVRGRWAAREGRLGGQPGPAEMVCSRCGALASKPSNLLGCTEKRGEGSAWTHSYQPFRTDPWAGMPARELFELALYFRMKAAGSFATVKTWLHTLHVLESEGVDDPDVRGAIALYTEKSWRRARMLAWTVSVLEARLAAGESLR